METKYWWKNIQTTVGLQHKATLSILYIKDTLSHYKSYESPYKSSDYYWHSELNTSILYCVTTYTLWFFSWTRFLKQLFDYQQNISLIVLLMQKPSIVNVHMRIWRDEHCCSWGADRECGYSTGPGSDRKVSARSSMSSNYIRSSPVPSSSSTSSHYHGLHLDMILFTIEIIWPAVLQYWSVSPSWTKNLSASEIGPTTMTLNGPTVNSTLRYRAA